MSVSVEQRLLGLERAREVRRVQVEVRRRVASGELSVTVVLADLPDGLRSLRVDRLLVSQRYWGVVRTRRFLRGVGVRENKPLGELTERQRRVLESALRNRAEFYGSGR